MSQTAQRKQDHLRIATEESIAFRHKTAGFDRYDFMHCALPEGDFDAVDTAVEFLGKRLSWPFMISAMTGGHQNTTVVNRQLAEVCAATGVALGLGSQRQALENDTALESYRVARRIMPEGVIVGNIGAAQLAHMPDMTAVQRLVDLVEADAMAVHLNPLQELLQPEGDRDFSGVLCGIEKLVRQLTVPVLVKEVGCGISLDVGRRLLDIGVTLIDVAGAGGTSWAGIESQRGGHVHLAETFWDWGLPTAECVAALSDLNLTLIASGGVNSGLDVAKAVALGAHLGGAARPMLLALLNNGAPALEALIQQWRTEFKMALYLTGNHSLAAFRKAPVLIKK